MFMRTKCNAYFHDIVLSKASGFWIFGVCQLGIFGHNLVGLYICENKYNAVIQGYYFYQSGRIVKKFTHSLFVQGCPFIINL